MTSRFGPLSSTSVFGMRVFEHPIAPRAMTRIAATRRASDQDRAGRCIRVQEGPQQLTDQRCPGKKGTAFRGFDLPLPRKGEARDARLSAAALPRAPALSKCQTSKDTVATRS